MIFKRVLPLVLAALAGLVSGMYIRLGFEIVKGRPFSPGGEALFLPLVGLLLYLGYNIGKDDFIREFSKVDRKIDMILDRAMKQGGKEA